MSEEKIPMSKEDATELAKRLHAVMSFDAIPDALYHDMSVALNDLFNEADRKDLIEDKPAHIRDILLGYTGNTEAIEDEETGSTLPQLLSDVFKHEDLPESLADKLWEVFADNTSAEAFSPYHFANALGLEVSRPCAVAKKPSPEPVLSEPAATAQ